MAQVLCGCGCCRPAATAPIQPLAWKRPYAMGVALKRHTPPPQKKVLRGENFQPLTSDTDIALFMFPLDFRVETISFLVWGFLKHL